MSKFACLRVCLWLLGFLLISVPDNDEAWADDQDDFRKSIKPFFEKYCLACHDAETEEGNVNLADLNPIHRDNAEVWKRIWEQVALKEMPPPDENVQPENEDRNLVSLWITGNLERELKPLGGFFAHRLPSKANHLAHELLFGKTSRKLEPASTPARIWRINPQEHLVRINALINIEPVFDPQKPGLRTRGDFVPPNLDGEVKVYYGLDRVIGWVGGTAAYAAAITGFPPMLSSSNDHGLRSYPLMHTVNGAEATQIARTAENVLRFMAYGPDAKPYQFADKVSEIPQEYKHESLRGLAESLFYSKQVKRPLTPVYKLMQEDGVSQKTLRESVKYLFENLTCREPTEREIGQYVKLANHSIKDLGKQKGALLGLVPIFLDREALFRTELGAGGRPDEYGRVMLQGNELMLAINAAFSYLPPDQELKKSLSNGKLNSRKDVCREVERILDDPAIRKPRLIQFFREFFDYDRAGSVCKDNKALAAAGGNVKNYYRVMNGMVTNTDRLVELILEEDRNVLRELLTTDRIVVDPATDSVFFGEFVGKRKSNPDSNDLSAREKNTNKNKKARKKKDNSSPLVAKVNFPRGKQVHVRIAEVVKPVRTQRQLTRLPTSQRKGILTHPSWLVSHSDAMDNHAIHRGKWIRERLIGDAVPDVPITVDAMLPDEPNTTLRHRMRVTRHENCWRCHQKMDPLGLPFEMFNHLGIYRTEELKKSVDTSGQIIQSGDASLDGPVTDALDLIEKLAASERVTQVFVRHVFRFWIGRNETVNDAPILQAAYHAYRESGGSMKALLTSILTSDAFLYRKIKVP